MTNIESNAPDALKNNNPDSEFWVNSTNEAFGKLQRLSDVEDKLAPMETGSWDRIIELETDETAWDHSIPYLCRAVDEVTKGLIKDDMFNDAIILPLVSVNYLSRTFKLLILMKFDDQDYSERLYTKVYRKFYSNYGEYFYKNVDSNGFRKLNDVDIQAKISGFEHDGINYYLGAHASLPHIEFSAFLNSPAFECSYDHLQ